MESGSIQLPFGFVRDQKTNDDLQFNLPLNYWKDLLFDKLPYVAQLNNPAIENVVNRNSADDLAVQKYLLATDLLQDTIQENLNMIVTDGGFNNASICRVLDTKYPSVMKKPNPILCLKIKLNLTYKTQLLDRYMNKLSIIKKWIMCQLRKIFFYKKDLIN